MRVVTSWLAELCDPGLEPVELADVLTMGGLEVDAIERPGAGTSGVRVVEVLDHAPVEGSDKLTLVHVSDGEDAHEIVCGASNFAIGDRVPAALPGAVLPGGLEIGRKKLMGVVSGGMLASARELGVGDDHSGIWILDPDAPVGADLHDVVPLDEAVLSIELTPDRGYALGLWGIARDLAALTGAELTLPELGGNPGGGTGVQLTVHDRVGCRRWDGRRITGVAVRHSPARVRQRLAFAGVRPISNVVDATNYAMLETGHPVHAYDTELLRGRELHVRRAEPGEELVTLDGVSRRLEPEDLVIADAEGAIGLAGIMGGEGTEVASSTTDLYVEVAAWDPVTVLRTGRRLKLFTEARTRFERGLSTHTVPLGATRVADLIVAWAGGAVAGGEDQHPTPDVPPTIVLRPGRARARLGLDVEAEQQAALLGRLGCEVAAGGDAAVLEVTPPPWRPDLQLEEDLYEEIARLVGYDRFTATVPSTGQAGKRPDDLVATGEVRRALVGGGWTEVLLFPFIAAADLDRLELPADDRRRRVVALVNPLSQEEEVLRTSLLPGLLACVRRNVNRGNTDLALFETGHVFVEPDADSIALESRSPGVALPAEPELLGFAACGDAERRRHDRAARPFDFADLSGAVELVRRAVGAAGLRLEAADELPYHPGRCARVAFGEQAVGIIGELHPRVCEAFEVPARTLAGELRLDRIVAGGVALPEARLPSPLPGMTFDVAVIVPETAAHARVRDVIAGAAGDRLTSIELFDVYRGEQVGEGNRSLAFTLRLDDPSEQLTDADQAAAIERIVAAVSSHLGGQVRR